jgi:hypothetical protein
MLGCIQMDLLKKEALKTNTRHKLLLMGLNS